MSGLLSFWPLIPVLLPTVAACSLKAQGRRKPSGATLDKVTMFFGYTLLALAVFMVLFVAAGSGSVSIGIQMDILSANVPIDFLTLGLAITPTTGILSAMVMAIGGFCALFARRYLEGDPALKRFLIFLGLTIGSVQGFLFADSLMLMVACWIAVSLNVNRLLLLYPERIEAQRAASKKSVLARIGDILFLIAAVLLTYQAGTDNLSAALDAANQAAGGITFAAGLLIAFAAVLKAAQFPFQSWLIEVMETPTPVSALLHGGIVNAGGILILRFADIIALNTTALLILLLFGAVTSIVGSAAMMVQTSIKAKLAWSTVAQMGLMMIQCGFGAFTFALLHIVAHSFYKAHSFLSAGSVISETRLATPESNSPADGFWFGAILVSCLTIVFAFKAVNGTLAGGNTLFFAAILALGLSGLWIRMFEFTTLNLKALFMVVGIMGASVIGYLVLHHGIVLWVPELAALSENSEAVSGIADFGAKSIILILLSLLAFAQWRYRTAAPSGWTARFFLHARNGFYAGMYLDRWLAHHRQSPAKPAEVSR